MTVKELRDQLSEIEDQDQEVIYDGGMEGIIIEVRQEYSEVDKKDFIGLSD